MPIHVRQGGPAMRLTGVSQDQMDGRQSEEGKENDKIYMSLTNMYVRYTQLYLYVYMYTQVYW